MVNFDQAKTRFSQYVNDNFDINDAKIAHKLKHTFAVVDMAEYIANGLKLDAETVELAKLIALLHDIGRFEQAKVFNNFLDYETLDHAELGVKILFDDKFIRQLIDTDEFDELIKASIFHHNKYQINEVGMSEAQILHSKLIRDADKTEILRGNLSENQYVLDHITQSGIEDSYISDSIYHNFMSKKLIVNSETKTPIDIWISNIAFIFDYHFNVALKYVKENNYINILVDRFDYKQPDTKQKMEEIRKLALDYIEANTK